MNSPKPKRVRDRAKMREYNRVYNKTDKARLARRRYAQTERGKAKNQRWAQRVRWARDLMARYGLTVETYAWMLHDQDFCCAICNGTLSVDVVRHEEQRKKIRPCVDHEHETGRVRGILCSGCNYHIVGGLERGGDILILRAMRYLGWDATKRNAQALRLAIEDLS